jgi:hypothetical protein
LEILLTTSWLGSGDVPVLIWRSDNGFLRDVHVSRNVAASGYTHPVLYVRGRQNVIDVTYRNDTPANDVAVLELDSTAFDNVINIVTNSGFRDYPPLVTLSNGFSGGAPVRNRVALRGPLPHDGWDLSKFTLNDSLTEADALANDWFVGARQAFIKRAGITDTSVSVAFSASSSGLSSVRSLRLW